LTRIDTARREGFHRWPRFLPDGRHFLYSVRGAAAQPGIYAGSLDGKTKKFLVRSDSNAFYASPGYLLYLDQDMLLAQPFDAGSLELKGSPFPVADRVGRSSFGDGAVAVSQTGVLAYAGPILRTGHLTWFDRMGSEIGIAGAEGDYTDFRLSPDGTRLAASLVDARAGWPDIWLTDLTRGSTFRYTFGPFLAASPLWSPDGTRLVFRRTPRGVTEFFEKSAAGAGNEQAVLTQDQERAAHVNSVTLVPTDWSPDGRNIIFAVPAIGSGFELWRLPMDGTSTPIRFLQSTADLMHANFSPDGKLIAYSSNESGRFEVYVQTFPLTDRKWQVSTSGGYEPRWRADGREIYYLSEGRKLMAAEVKPGSSFGVPKVLFQTRVPAGVNGLRTNYVPDRDGRRFLVNTQSSDAPPEAITVTVNWLTGHGTTTNGPAAR
ncbi:MAG TPA: hypothetical protein VHX39_15920, partial [Acetobacteraceae bacterium]|nr:hypothetical protein [Acetobacteraceae bacterium]